MSLTEMIINWVKLGWSLLEIIKKLRDDGYSIPYLEIKQIFNKVLKEKK